MPKDIAFRMGGDEFIIMLYCNMQNAISVAGRIQDAFERHWNEWKSKNDMVCDFEAKFAYGLVHSEEISKKLSTGQATIREVFKEMFETADKRMYIKKEEMKARQNQEPNIPPKLSRPVSGVLDFVGQPNKGTAGISDKE